MESTNDVPLLQAILSPLLLYLNGLSPFDELFSPLFQRLRAGGVLIDLLQRLETDELLDALDALEILILVGFVFVCFAHLFIHSFIHLFIYCF